MLCYTEAVAKVHQSCSRILMHSDAVPPGPHGGVVWLLLQLPKILELVGVAYTGWFVYRYLLFKVGPLYSETQKFTLFTSRCVAWVGQESREWCMDCCG